MEAEHARAGDESREERWKRLRRQQKDDARRRLLEDFQERIHSFILHAFHRPDETAAVSVVHFVQPFLQSPHIIDADRVGARVRLRAMLLRDIGCLRDHGDIFADILDPQLIENEESLMEEAINLIARRLHRIRIRDAVGQKHLCKPFCNRELSQMPDTGEEIRVRDVPIFQIMHQCISLEVVADDGWG